MLRTVIIGFTAKEKYTTAYVILVHNFNSVVVVALESLLLHHYLGLRGYLTVYRKVKQMKFRVDRD